MTSEAAFRELFGAEPAGTWSAPGRVNLIGEHTDYNRGLALPFAIDLRTSVTVRPRDDDLLRLRSRQHPHEPVDLGVDEVARGRPRGWSAYAAGVVAVLRRRGAPTGGVDLLVDGNVPPGAGLSSSAALECAVALAADELFGAALTPVQLAAVAQEAENTVVGVPCGPMDQRVAMLAQPGCALLLDFARDTAAQVPLELDAAGCSLVVVDTGVRHALADGQYAERRDRCRRAAGILGVASLSDIHATEVDDALARLDDDRLRAAVRHVVSENQRVRDTVDALAHGDLRRAGAYLTASHVSLRDDYAVSCPELDLGVETLLDAGAVGARMTGGGFGGSAVAIVPTDQVDAAAAAVAQAFGSVGYPQPNARVVTPSPGARRDC